MRCGVHHSPQWWCLQILGVLSRGFVGLCQVDGLLERQLCFSQQATLEALVVDAAHEVVMHFVQGSTVVAVFRQLP